MRIGLWAWHNLGPTIDRIIQVAEDIRADTLILKCGWSSSAQAAYIRPNWDWLVGRAAASGLAVGAEVYPLPEHAANDGAVLGEATERPGVYFGVANLEEPWEADDGWHTTAFWEAVRSRTSKPLFLCSDTRGYRIGRAYTRASQPFVVGNMPMVYAKTFYPSRPLGFVQRAFDQTLGQGGKPPLHPLLKARLLLPVVQGYDGIDYHEAAGQVVCAKAWGAHAVSAYAAHDLDTRARWGFHDAAPLFVPLRHPAEATLRKVRKLICG